MILIMKAGCPDLAALEGKTGKKNLPSKREKINNLNIKMI